jgi:thiamine biosynthesis lipoprotein
VVAETTAVADAMATALLVLGPEDGMILALSLDIAAFFLIHGKSGIEEMMTPAFAAFRTKQ